MISTATTNDRGTTPALFEWSTDVLAGRRTPVGMQQTGGRAGTTPARVAVDHRTTAQLRASDLLKGQVCLRPVTPDVIAPTAGHPAWSPPT